MKPVCYLALVSRGDPAPCMVARAMAALPRTDAATLSAGKGRLTVLVDRHTVPRSIAPAGGLIVGRIFRRQTNRPVSGGEVMSLPAVGVDGGGLLADYWGGYVAFIAESQADRWTILRAPFGSVPCYYVIRDGIVALASHVDLLVAAGLLEPEIDHGYLVDHLLHPELRTASTGLAGVCELLGGTRLVVAPDDIRLEEAWSPWSFLAPRGGRVDKAEAAHGVRRSVLAATNAWAAASGPILLTVSGGLDSSIVAASLARSGARFTCLTLRTDDAAGDEEAYAAAMTRSIGATLLSRRYTLDDVDVARCDSAHLPRPLARSFVQGLDRASLRVVREVGATTIFNGSGGDNVFCLLQSAAPLADRLLDGDLIGAWRTLNDICRLTDSDYRSVVRRAVAKLSQRRRGYRWTNETQFLRPEILPIMPSNHAWLTAPPDARPGDAAHIALLIAIQNHLEGFLSELTMTHVSPLLSQPVVEACLAIPSWLWCRGGINRAVARDAFADDLPPAVLHRRSKGTPDGFCALIFQAQRPRIREMLGDGLLAKWGIIDLKAVLRSLDAKGPLRGLDHLRLLTLADVEAWARTWDAARPQWPV